jgi:hypothetical protein
MTNVPEVADEWSVRALQGRVRRPVDPLELLEVREVVAEGHVDDRVGGFDASPQAVEILERAAMHGGTEGVQAGGRRV